MADLRSVLDDATKAALISPETAERLLPFLLDRHVAVASDGAAGTDFAAQGLAEDRLNADLETPRFVRGFHDILITIGVIILLSGIWGLASLYVVPVAIIVLSEILVVRQRLALP